jgi:multiple sugar transport system substrate-binding protein
MRSREKTRINRISFIKMMSIGIIFFMVPFFNLAKLPVALGAELSLITWSHFVPAVNDELRAHAEEFSKERGVKVRIDTIDLGQIAIKKAAEAQAKVGHDIVQNYGADTLLYQNLYVSVDDLVKEFSDKYGGHIQLSEDICKVGGIWKSVPWYYYGWPINYRKDLVEQVGGPFPDTWENTLEVGKKLKKIGKPIGLQLSHCRDANGGLRSFLWAYGASVTAKDGKTITINSPQTEEALKLMTELYKQAMSPDVISWDDTGNNRAFLAGACSFAFNSPSIYFAAKSKNIKVAETGNPMADVIDIMVPPSGPQGRFIYGESLSLGIWKFSKNIELAKDFLRFHFERKRFNHFLEVAAGYNVPFFNEFVNNAIFTSDEKLKFNLEMGKYARTLGYPGPLTSEAQVVWDLHIIPDMFAYAATGKKTIPEAMKWAEAEIKAVYAGKKK